MIGILVQAFIYAAGAFALVVLARETKKTINYLRGTKP